jgi:hypothetical protein
MPRKRYGGRIRQRDQTRLNGFHLPVDFGQLLFGFAGVDIVSTPSTEEVIPC